MKAILSVMFAISLTLGIQANAHAIRLGFNDFNGTLFYVNDNSPLDSNPAVGAITFIGAIGSWTLNVTTGVSKPVIGSAEAPHMDLSSFNAETTSAGGRLRFGVSDIDFTGEGGLALNVGGTTGGTISFDLWGADDNNYFSAGQFITGFTPFSGPAFSGSTGGTFDATDTFSLTVLADIFHTGVAATSFNAEVKVPEPGTLILLGSGLIILAGYGRKKFFKK
jgi:hypothetical protein